MIDDHSTARRYDGFRGTCRIGGCFCAGNRYSLVVAMTVSGYITAPGHSRLVWRTMTLLFPSRDLPVPGRRADAAKTQRRSHPLCFYQGHFISATHPYLWRSVFNHQASPSSSTHSLSHSHPHLPSSMYPTTSLVVSRTNQNLAPPTGVPLRATQAQRKCGKWWCVSTELIASAIRGGDGRGAIPALLWCGAIRLRSLWDFDIWVPTWHRGRRFRGISRRVMGDDISMICKLGVSGTMITVVRSDISNASFHRTWCSNELRIEFVMINA